MDLRTQLSTHEAELAELKKRWERIVNRRYEREAPTPATPSSSTGQERLRLTTPAPNTNAASPGTMLDGLKESMQDIGRRLVDGLADLSTVPPPASPQTLRSKPRPLSLSAPKIRTHVVRDSLQSTSSASTQSTFAAESARLSLSSRSSVESAHEEQQTNKDAEAAPTTPVLPTPLEDPVAEEAPIPAKQTPIIVQTSAPAQLHRRRSKGTASSRGAAEPSSATSSPRHKSKLSISAPVTPVVPPSTQPERVLSPQGLVSAYTRSLLDGPEEAPLISDWVLKKLERGSVKRASTLLSDMGQSVLASLTQQQPARKPAPSTLR